ncbi:MAG: arginine--tRNA ligase [Flavobacteriaceae bacterium]|nr:arginine--tRNA ligase [Flavobacteriaceae bacterium]
MENQLKNIVKKLIKKRYGILINNLVFQSTRKEFDGDLTLLLFPLLNQIKTDTESLGKSIGFDLKEKSKIVEKFSIVKGFLNLTISDSFYISFLEDIRDIKNFGHKKPNKNSKTIMIEYSSPNTNKPLHLGHIRNNLLGFSMSKILEANGNNIIKTQIINDRGIHICKSMVAWKLFGKGKRPNDLKIKGDQFVGKFYVLYNDHYKNEVSELMKKGFSETEAKNNAPIYLKAKDLLMRWEQNDADVKKLWSEMNQWVYDGFEITYEKLGVDFDNIYYESDTYLLGKKIIQEGINKNVFYYKKDGSIWVDLSSDGLDEKLLIRSDGTSVYITQDLGTAFQRIQDNPEISGMVYTVGNEQDYHFKVLFLILKKLGYSWSKNLFHLSYGMVDLPSGKMKSREGTVVDADELVDSMIRSAEQISNDHGKIKEVGDDKKLYKTVGLGALKYFILKVDPKKRILFNPESSFDFNGNTGPFIQYAYARIQSILRNNENIEWNSSSTKNIQKKEKEILKQIIIYPEVIIDAGKMYSPSLIANYVYDLVKLFNSFYQNINILGEKDNNRKSFRLVLSKKVGEIICNSCLLLGVDVPERM